MRLANPKRVFYSPIYCILAKKQRHVSCIEKRVNFSFASEDGFKLSERLYCTAENGGCWQPARVVPAEEHVLLDVEKWHAVIPIIVFVICNLF